jgi:hypothetical protein
MIRIPPQHGKLLPADTPILTDKGFVNHGDLKRGDYVFDQDGKLRMVEGNSGVYDWDVHKITFNDGNTILASKEHLWKLMVEYDDHKGRREIIQETQDIFNKRHRRSPYIKCSPSLKTNQKGLPIDPYKLGCWLGDGDKRDPYLTCDTKDSNHFSTLGEILDVKGRPTIKRIKLGAEFRRAIIDNDLRNNKHIPIDYLLASHEQRMELLRGLMDTDGYCDKKGACEFSQKKGRLADDV